MSKRRSCPECGYNHLVSHHRCPMCLLSMTPAPPAVADRQYETEIHGQAVTVTVLPPGIARGANPEFKTNVRCKTYRYPEKGSTTPKPRRWRAPKRHQTAMKCGICGQQSKLELCSDCWSDSCIAPRQEV